VLVGKAFGVRAPFTPVTPITLLNVHLEPGSDLVLPILEGHMALALLVRGSGTFGRDAIPLSAHSAATFKNDGMSINIQASADGLEVLIGTGQPYNEAMVFGGPFVGSNQQDILEARARFQRGEMGLLEPSAAFGR
jgi:quercetin 2,3-dioxygenase